MYEEKLMAEEGLKRTENKVLSKKYVHSVRDDAAKELLESMGFKAVNTGCPTLWGLTPAFCANISKKKSNSAIMTLTSYQADIHEDLFEKSDIYIYIKGEKC